MLSVREHRCASFRDRQILADVGALRLITNKVLLRLRFQGQSPNAVVKVTRRLCKTGYLRKFPFVFPEAYYVLGKKAAQLLGLPAQRTEPLGPQALPIEYASLVYATLGRRIHRRLTVRELKSDCPSLPPGLPSGPVCLDDEEGDSVLEIIRVDLGGPADHVARKCYRDVRRWMRCGDFAPLCQQGRFRLVVITATAGKARSIESALKTRLWPDGLMFHLAVVSELVSLTAKVHNGAEKV